MTNRKKWNKLYNEMVRLFAKNLVGTQTDEECRKFYEICLELKKLES